jgi:hypothetical protein
MKTIKSTKFFNQNENMKMTCTKRKFNYHKHKNNHLQDFLTKRRIKVGLVLNLNCETRKTKIKT